MSIYNFFEWLGSTPASIALHESRYLYLIVLAAHVITLFVFVGSIIIQSLRLTGIALRHIPASEVLAALRPWSMTGFLVMFLTGSLLFFAAPLDKYLNLFFRLKLILMAAAAINLTAFYRTAYVSIDSWDRSKVPPNAARITGALSLFLWAFVITAGRMIPYQDYWL